MINLGEYVIINEFDKPCTRLVAKVTEVNGKRVKARYITKGTNLKIRTSDTENVMPVHRFGVRLVFDDGQVTGICDAQSTATYKDGKPRYWQPEHTETHALRPEREQLVMQPQRTEQPQRIQRKRTAGFNLQAVSLALNGLPAKSVTRPGKWGNPFKVGGYYKKGDFDDAYRGPFAMVFTQCLASVADSRYTKLTGEQVLEWFEWYLRTTKKDLSELRGYNLACWCPFSSPCHVDIYLKILAETE